ncbi:MAG: alpha-1,4-glucan--maltose-1-phosphate maltosyltransferase, partial [Nocardioidaceae bacterium]|nr:alpha-1,4-glucan--maltose-1-phosphate maltosyltransferase [Nocardioidaceae bacterium]
ARLAALEDDALWELLASYPLREMVTTSGPHPVFADRQRALFGSWYEFFPRSEGARLDDDGTVVSGTLRTAAERLDAVAAMGFDVI